MSRIAVLGAGGRLGARLMHDALDLDLRVNALTRNPLKVHAANELLTVFKGDVETGEGLARAIAGCRWIVTSISSTHPSECVSHLVKAISFRGLERLVFVARADNTVPSHGVGERFASVLGHRKEDLAKDLSAGLELLQVSGLPYLVIKTNGITDAPGGHPVVATEVGQALPGKISRVNLSRFILKSLEEPEWNLREINLENRA